MSQVANEISYSTVQLVLFPAEQYKGSLEDLWARVISEEPPAKIERRPAAATEIAEGAIEGNQIVLATGPLRVELKVGPAPPQTPAAFLAESGTTDLDMLVTPVKKFAPKLIEAIGSIVRVGYVVTSQKTCADQVSANAELLAQVNWNIDPSAHSDMNVQFNERKVSRVADKDVATNVLKRFHVGQIQTGFIAVGQLPVELPFKLGETTWIVQAMIDANNVQTPDRIFQLAEALDLIDVLASTARDAWA